MATSEAKRFDGVHTDDWKAFIRDFEQHAQNVENIHKTVGLMAADLSRSREQLSQTVGNAIKLAAVVVLSIEILFGSILVVMILKDTNKTFKAGSRGIELGAP